MTPYDFVRSTSLGVPWRHAIDGLGQDRMGGVGNQPGTQREFWASQVSLAGCTDRKSRVRTPGGNIHTYFIRGMYVRICGFVV